MKPNAEIFFGGPDQPRGRLRDILAERVRAVPAGGAIDWVTYYFRDRRLAEELLRARGRGVEVRLTLQGAPRTAAANECVLAMLRGPQGLGAGLRVVSLPGLPAPPGRAWKPQLHEKLYCFSHPRPIAFVGSFNPSGDTPEERPDLISEIGDQDCGHNMLVGLAEPALLEPLVRHARRLHRQPPGLLYRFRAEANRAARGSDTEIHFLPGRRRHPVARFLDRFGAGARVRIAASHIHGRRPLAVLLGLARRGAAVTVMSEASLRRVPAAAEARLAAAGIAFQRVGHAHGAPMHLKFTLVEDGGRCWSVFGSYNWTTPSFWLNHEIAAISTAPEIFTALVERWQVLTRQADAQAGRPLADGGQAQERP